MIRKMLFISVFILTIVSVTFATPNIKEGKWEMTTKMEMKGMPMEMPAVKHTQCLTKQDFVPQEPAADQKCEPVKSKVSGDTVTWTIKCNGEGGPMTGNGKITYSGDSFKGTVNMKQGGMDMTSHISGKYIGKCD